MDNIKNIQNCEYQLSINIQLFFEIILVKVREKTIQFSKRLKRKENLVMQELISEIELLEAKILMRPDLEEILDEKKGKLQEHRNKLLEGVLIRSRARWLYQGEKPTRYFCNLENRNFQSKRMTSLIIESGEEITDELNIIKEVKDFYEKLYKSKDDGKEISLNCLESLSSPCISKLSEENSELMDGELTYNEISHALKKMKNNKSLGSDGFTVEFFKFFWNIFGHILLRSLNWGYQNNKLSTTQREGVITCIPKGKKPKKFIKNWRPITLLNVTYKIAAAALANRVKKILPTIIGLNQCGFMATRFTGDNIRLVYDILNYALKNNKLGLLILIDFEKAFDSISWSFLIKCLEYFNFGQSFLKWITVFINDIKARMNVNSSYSSWFSIQRGCRQGDPLSPYLFLICSEVLAHMIRNNADVKGFKLNTIDIKISQFADDTSLFLDGSKQSFETCINTIIKFGEMSGLKINFDKTKIVWFGCTRPPEEKYMTHLRFEWNPEEVSILGVNFTTNLNKIADNNIIPKLEVIKKELKQWSRRDLNPLGRITVLKSLMLSKIVHILIALPTPSRQIIKQINEIFFKFLWNDKPDKIARNIAKRPFRDGGINMIDVDRFICSLKISWFRRLYCNDTVWKKCIIDLDPRIIDIFKYGTNITSLLTNKLKNDFWDNVFKALERFVKSIRIETKEQFNSLSFLHNNEIKIDKKCINFKIFAKNNITFIHHLLNETNGTFLTLRELNEKYNINMNFLTFHSVKEAVKSYEKKLKLKDDPLKYNHNKFQMQYHFFLINNVKKSSSCYYKCMIPRDDIPKGVAKWKELAEYNDWKKYFTNVKAITIETKLLWFQYRILHNILTTNKSINKYNPNQSLLCEFCHKKEETILHILWECDIVKNFWSSLEVQMNSRVVHSFNFKFSDVLIIFGCSKKNNY